MKEDSDGLPERLIGSAATEKEPLPPKAEMVERVAARIWLFSNTCDLTISGRCGSEDCECMIDARYAARAALDEMREPTVAMIEAADAAVGEWRKTLSRDEAMMRSYRPPLRTSRKFIASATPAEKHSIRYRAMIDAALLAAREHSSPRQVDDAAPGRT